MTMPHLMNCLHNPDGWCLDCVKELWEEKEKSRQPFLLNNSQILKLQDWMDSHTNNLENCGACGGLYTYALTPTSLGVVYKVINNLTEDEIDLTEYEDW